MPVECRKAEAGDIDAIVALEQLCFSIPWSRTSIENEVCGSRFARFFVAEADGQIAAYIGSRLLMGECEIFNVATHPDHQGQGIATALMEYFIAQVESEGAGAISLDVRPSNAPALALYRKFGFEDKGRRPHYYTDGEDAIIMWR